MFVADNPAIDGPGMADKASEKSPSKSLSSTGPVSDCRCPEPDEDNGEGYEK